MADLCLLGARCWPFALGMASLASASQFNPGSSSDQPCIGRDASCVHPLLNSTTTVVRDAFLPWLWFQSGCKPVLGSWDPLLSLLCVPSYCLSVLSFGYYCQRYLSDWLVAWSCVVLLFFFTRLWFGEDQENIARLTFFEYGHSYWL